MATHFQNAIILGHYIKQNHNAIYYKKHADQKTTEINLTTMLQPNTLFVLQALRMPSVDDCQTALANNQIFASESRIYRWKGMLSLVDNSNAYTDLKVLIDEIDDCSTSSSSDAGSVDDTRNCMAAIFDRMLTRLRQRKSKPHGTSPPP